MDRMRADVRKVGASEVRQGRPPLEHIRVGYFLL